MYIYDKKKTNIFILSTVFQFQTLHFPIRKDKNFHNQYLHTCIRIQISYDYKQIGRIDNLEVLLQALLSYFYFGIRSTPLRFL